MTAKEPIKDLEFLRQRAENLLPKSRREIGNMPAEDIENLLNDLEVHQIELKLQNEELLQAYQELADARDCYADLYEFAPIGYLLLDDEMNIVDSNLAAADMLGLERKKLIGSQFTHYVAYDAQDAFYHYRQKVFASAEKQICELELRRHNGTPLVFRLDSVCYPSDSTSPIGSEESQSRLCRTALIDLTQEKDAQHLRQKTEQLQHEIDRTKQEQELAHYDRVSMMAEMATSLAHELNQPLTAITQFCDAALTLLKKESPSSAELTAVVNDTYNEAQRAGEIIRRLRAFLKKDEAGRFVVNIIPLIEETVHFIDFEARADSVDVNIQVPKKNHPLLVKIERIQIQQVLLNLMRNALHALEGSSNGKLSISVNAEDDKNVRVNIHDTGPGLDPDIVDHLFEPFRTTKLNGMGMGLTISRSIVESHGGRLWADTAGPGTSFVFTLPWVTE